MGIVTVVYIAWIPGSLIQLFMSLQWDFLTTSPHKVSFLQRISISMDCSIPMMNGSLVHDSQGGSAITLLLHCDEGLIPTI